jgi:hypothetical protein
MGILEAIGEWISPGPIGSVRVGRPAPPRRPTWMMVAHAVMSVIALAVLLVFAGVPHGAGGILGCLGYVAAGTVLRPNPEFSNIGWLGGLIDHPFRWSDDVNRFLILLLMILWPGRFIGTGILDLMRSLVAASSRIR